MKKRMLFILIVLVSFTPAVFADGNGAGPFDKSNDASAQGASICPSVSVATDKGNDSGSSATAGKTQAGTAN